MPAETTIRERNTSARERRAAHQGAEAQRRARWRRGQGMVIFALSVTVLVGLAGLALDSMRVYDLYAREQRAAEAGALAGDLYMPNYYSTTYTSGTTTYSAVSRALLEVSKNGFSASGNGDCTQVGQVDGVFACKVTADKNGLQVTVTQHIDVVLLSAVGVQGFDVSASATASYLTPFILGSQNPNDVNSTYWSDGGECDAQPQNCKSHTPPHHFVAFINGPAEMKEQGDPYVWCQDGDSYGSSQTVHDPSATTSSTYSDPTTGWMTNFPTYGSPACGTGNVDQQTSGSGAYAATNPTGHSYSYGITVSAGASVSLFVWNPSFMPTVASGSSCSGLTELDSFYLSNGCTAYYSHFGPVTPGGRMDDPRLYFNVGYSLYPVDVSYGSTASPIAKFSAPPYDAMPSDLTLRGCGNSQVWRLNTTTTSTDGACVNASSTYQYSFKSVTGKLGPGTYRLTVGAFPWDNDASCASSLSGTCGWGFHSYGVKLCPANTSENKAATCSLGPLPNGQPAATLNPWTNMALSFDFQSNSSVNVIPIADIPPAFAGRTVTVSVFDPGDTSFGNAGDMYFAVVPPATSDGGATNPAYSPTFPQMVSGAGPGGPYLTPMSCPTSSQYCPPAASAWWIHASAASSNSLPSSNDFNGLWISITFQLPAGYLGGQWWFTTINGQGNGFDHVTVGLSINGGSPVHLVG